MSCFDDAKRSVGLARRCHQGTVVRHVSVVALVFILVRISKCSVGSSFRYNSYGVNNHVHIINKFQICNVFLDVNQTFFQSIAILIYRL